MASIRKINGSKNWFACITRADGTRTTVTTKTPDRTKAKQFAERLQEAERKAAAGRATTDHMKRLFNEVLARAGEDLLCTETVEKFLKEWLKGKANPSTAERYEHTVDLFFTSLENRKTAPLTSIGHRDIIKFIESRKEGKAAPKTILVDVKTLNTAFNLARKLGHIQTNPVEKALALHPIECVSSEKECFDRSQVVTLVGAAKGDWKTAILLGYFTGARLGDCANMTWSSINFEEGVVDYLPQKTRKKNKRVIVPMHTELRVHLENIRRCQPNEPVCPSLAGRRTGGKSGLSEEFKKIMESAAISQGLVDGKGKRKFSKLSFHSLRHSFNSVLANSGVDQETRMRLTGHSSVDINKGYTHIDLPKLQKAISLLPSLTAASSAPKEEKPTGDSSESNEAGKQEAA